MFPLTTFLISIDNEESSCGPESNDHTVTLKWTNHLANEAFGKVRLGSTASMRGTEADFDHNFTCITDVSSLLKQDHVFLISFVYAARSKEIISAKAVPVTKCIK